MKALLLALVLFEPACESPTDLQRLGSQCGRYTFEEVQVWFGRFSQEGFAPGITMIDNDEVRGCLVIGVFPNADRSAVIQRLKELRIPLEAVLIVDTAAAIPV